MSSPIDQLHPALAHHVVNSLGWRSLRPLQEAAIEPVTAGAHAVLLAPTAGGKTEAAFLPVLSRVLTEDWRGLSVVYLCPLRALLNNLHPRLERYAELVGRRVGLWHGDVGDSERRRLLNDPPDVLLTTPESLEAMLVSQRVDHARFFAGVQVAIVDEAHAFAADDRGWHLLAVLERVTRLARRPIQRLALSATVGNPDQLLEWVTATVPGERLVVAPPAPGGAEPEVMIDFVGSLENAALVISRLHRGEKRLVFVDSRARAEKLASELRSHEVQTFVSHGSLGREERLRAEQAFAEGDNCVIVATGTLELGIDVGDLDRVIQIDAPGTVASFLQRLGRSGRRAGTTRNMLFLATSDMALVQACGLVHRWGQGAVEPVVPPPFPVHLAAQQLMGLTLQEGSVGSNTWTEWLGRPCALGAEVGEVLDDVAEHLADEGFVFSDGGMLVIGPVAESEYGRRHFLDLLAAFTSAPMLSVRQGRTEIGLVPDEVLLLSNGRTGGAAVLLLAGRSWQVTAVDWTRRVVEVVPTESGGVAKWSGGGFGAPASVCRAMREMLGGTDPCAGALSRRAAEKLAAIREEHFFVRDGATSLQSLGEGRFRWWTFAGLRANHVLSAALRAADVEASRAEALTIDLTDVDMDQFPAVVASLDVENAPLDVVVVANAVDALKFSDCLPPELAYAVVTARLEDRPNALVARGERLVKA